MSNVPNDPIAHWNQRFSTEAYVFGEAPNAFLARQAPLLPKSGRALAVADGEGRNGVWLAQQGLQVLSVDASPVAQEKARKLASRRGVTLDLQIADLSAWPFAADSFDVVAGIFIQFAPPPVRARMFAGMKAALRKGGLLLIEGYRPEQLAYGTGGPRVLDQLYTEALLREAFGDMEIIELASYDAHVEEGCGHSGMSALIDLVARRAQ